MEEKGGLGKKGEKEREKMVTSVNMIFQFIVSSTRKSSTLCE